MDCNSRVRILFLLLLLRLFYYFECFYCFEHYFLHFVFFAKQIRPRLIRNRKLWISFSSWVDEWVHRKHRKRIANLRHRSIRSVCHHFLSFFFGFLAYFFVFSWSPTMPGSDYLCLYFNGHFKVKLTFRAKKYA